MDYQNRVGSKKGGGGLAGDAENNQQRRERLRQLMLSKVDIDNDPYVFKNHLGMLECRLCFTTHVSEVSYMTHTHGKKHQFSLLKRAESEKKRSRLNGGDGNGTGSNVLSLSNITKKSYQTIGRPSYRVTKIRDPISYQRGLLFQINYRSIKRDVVPKYRLMSTFEQKIEPVDKDHQYLVVSAEPYENIGFKISADPIDTQEGRFWDYWDEDTKEYFVQFFYLE